MGDIKKDSLSKDTIIYTLGNYFVKAIAVLFAPVFTRLLSTDAYGKVTLYTTWLSFFGIFACFELKGTIINAFAKYGEDDFKGYVKNCITISAFSTIAFVFLVFIFHEYTESLFEMPYELCMVGIVHAFFNGMLLFLSHYLTMKGKSIKYIIVSAIQAVLNVVLSLLFIFILPLNRYLSRIGGQLVSSALIGIGIIFYFCINRKKFIRQDYITFAIPLALPLLFHALSSVVLAGADKVMLAKLTTNSEVGIYGFSGAVLALLNTLTVSFYTAWRPYLFDKLKEGKFDELRNRMKSYIRCFSIGCIGFMLIQPELVKILSDKPYWSCIPTVIPLVIGEFFFFLYTSVMCYELFYQKNIWIPIGSIGAAIINILINLLILKYWGAMGAAISTLVSNVALWLFHDTISRKIVKGYYYPFRSYALPIAVVVICAVISYFTINMPVIRWPLAICLAAVFLGQTYKTKTLF